MTIVALVLIAFGFFIGGMETYQHYRAGESVWSLVPFGIASLAILFGGLIIQFDTTSKAFSVFGPFVIQLIAAVRPGGSRSTDPPAEPPPATLPRSGVPPSNPELRAAIEEAARGRKG